MRDSYRSTNRHHCPSHEMWSYERDGRWRGWSFVRGSTVHACARANVKTLRPTFQLSHLGAVDGGLGLWLSLEGWDFW